MLMMYEDVGCANYYTGIIIVRDKDEEERKVTAEPK